jgi:hypothetical protein
VTLGAVLAAGAGSRFGPSTHKLLVPFRGRPLLAWALEALAGAGLDDAIVVTGAADVSAVVSRAGVRAVPNPGWRDGQATSLGVAVREAAVGHHDAVVVGLGDQPLVEPEAWRRVAAAGGAVAVATYEGRRGNPVGLGRSVWPLLPVGGDAGARMIMRTRPDLVTEVPCPGWPLDVDTPGDLDLAAVTALLGRPPRGDFQVVVRDRDGGPLVVRNAPLLHDGTPMPTRHWLVGEAERLAVSRLEAAGGVRRAEAAVPAAVVAATHARAAAEREAALPPGWTGPRPSGGVAGTRQGVKCLHAHYAEYLAGVDDPLGRWVAEQLRGPAPG